MIKAHLVKNYIEINNQGNTKLCEFHRTINVCDIPPVGYSISFSEIPESETIGHLYIENADMQALSGSLTLYGSMHISHYDNWLYDTCLLVIVEMHKKGWKIKNIHEEIKERSELKGVI